MKKEELYLGRGLHSAKWASFDKGGLLYPLLEIIKRDQDLVIELRNDYVNIYYKGGNMAKIQSENSIQFDENYFKGKEEYRGDDKYELRLKEKRNLIDNLKKTRDYQSFINKMKRLMDSYWIWLKTEKHKSLTEKDTQHQLCICNNEQTEYTVIDLEFQVSTISDYRYVRPEYIKGRYVDRNKRSPRFDIVAVRNSDKQLCVIELKSGCCALYGKSGIGDHADSFEGTVCRNPNPFLKEIKEIVKWKANHGLLPKDFCVSDKAPLFMYAYSFKKDDKDDNGVIRSNEEQKLKFIDELRRQQSDCYQVMFLEEGCFELSDAMSYKL